MKSVLVTGANGFIGRHCLPLLLSNGYEVHAISRKKSLEKQHNLNWVQADLLDPKQISILINQINPSHLLHLAWCTKPGEYWTSLENLNWVLSSMQLLQEFIDNGGNRVVMAGTCAEYDWTDGHCKEDVTPLRPKTLYGISKHALGNILSNLTKKANVSSAWGRVFFL